MAVGEYRKVDVADSWAEGWRMMHEERAGVECAYHIEDLIRLVINRKDVRVFSNIFSNARAFHKEHGLDLDRMIGEPRYELGWVYALHADNHNFKIGKSVQVDRRVEQIGLIVPHEITLARAVLTDAMSFHERFLHRLFWDSHVCGEWFQLDFWQFCYLFVHSTCHYFYPEGYHEGLTSTMRSIERDYEFERLHVLASPEERASKGWFNG